MLPLLALFFVVQTHVYSDTAGALPEALAQEVVEPSPEIAVPGALEAINAYRATKNLPAVHLDAQLNSSAQAKAEDLVARGYFEHFYKGQTPWDFMTAAGFEYVRAGENLAKCYSDGPSVVKAWINSPTHEAILTGDYTVAGLGIAYNAEDHCNYVVGHFGSRS